MAAPSPWPLIHGEREALAGDLTALTGEQWATESPADGLAEFRKHVSDTTHPPGPAESMLGEAVVHGEDIRRPLGIKRAYPAEAVTGAAGSSAGPISSSAANGGSPGSACGPTTSSGRPAAAPR